ncbi:MAG: MBL fold metallo-hydrolase [Bifidobacteriaceae bacterium]|jgi:glyoxylase-like metal-dependent hydrolase (beta-lactamase superfamily II)|nr:MBL fold metallo-hydrolase [Bifidobacteriaceae bacterium]
MRITSGSSGIFQANWYVVGPEHGNQCVVIDPGQHAAQPCVAAVQALGRDPAAVLATHGHIDHIAAAAYLADTWNVPLYIHGADRPFLTDPVAALTPDAAPMIHSLFPDGFHEPPDVREYQLDSGSETGVCGIGGMEFQLRHAPGHTPGCTLLLLEDGTGPVAFTGDVVFAGSIGRTDFRVGDPAAMRRSLRRQVLSLPDAARLLPGHGPATSMAIERETNPYLREEFLNGAN